MHIIIIRNYKIKAIISCAVLLLGALILLFSHYILNNNLVFKVTINDYLSFSHPISFRVNNILVNENLDEKAVIVNYSFRKATKQNYIDFKDPETDSSFKYPSSFNLAQEQFSDSEILYHIDFQNQETKGYIQVWNLPYSLSDFLSKSEPTSQPTYKEFDSKPIEVNDLNGFAWYYSVLGTDKVCYKGTEAYLQKAERMYRISYFAPDKIWSNSHEDIFWKIVKSLKIY